MLYPPGFYYVEKTKRFVILSPDRSSERNLSCFFDIIKPRRIEHLQNEEPFSSDPYFKQNFLSSENGLNMKTFNSTSWFLLDLVCELTYVVDPYSSGPVCFRILI